jgi:meso-butanediol dehydrogenase/(S,S)-butanediol dehydrogenase/diacetyl reductase
VEADFAAAVADVARAERTHYVKTDVTSLESVENAVAETVAKFGKLDILIPNAGTASFGDIETVPVAEWQRILDIIVNGQFFCVRAALPELRKTRGNVVTTASISGLGVNFSLNSYFGAKAAVINMTRYMALEYGKDGIRFNAVAPGPINSHPGPGALFEYPELEKHYAEVTPLGRVGIVDDLPGVYSFLASEDASWVTGQTIVADGGLTLWTGEFNLGTVMEAQSQAAG